MRRRLSGLTLGLLCTASAMAQTVDFAHDEKARVGVACVDWKGDTIAVNADQAFPMLSVYKFPQALAVADYCRRKGISFGDSIDISALEILPSTWSPLRDKYGRSDIRLPLSELLAYTLQQSDNNACDILFRFIGGPHVVDSLMAQWGFGDIRVVSTEEDMHRDVNLCYENSSTPWAMMRLVQYFDTDLRERSAEFAYIAELMENCSTGGNRLAAALKGEAGAVIGHKTGTGDRNNRGQIIGINDVGYVHLPDGRRYAIAVFVADSERDMAETEAVIARISEMVLRSGESQAEQGGGY